MKDELSLDSSLIRMIENMDDAHKQAIIASIDIARNIPADKIYEHSTPFKGELQQGDILLDMPIVDFQNDADTKADVKYGPCMIVSNTCDLNPKKRAPRLTYAPIMRATSYIEVLKKKGEDPRSLEGWMKSQVKTQKTNKLIWLEPSEKLDYEGLVVLDHLLSVSMSNLLPDREAVEAKWGGSMTMAGWFFMVAKLTSFYYRPTEEQLLYRLGIH